MKSLLTIVLLILTVLSCKNSSEESIKPQTKDITESVYASVQVRPEVSYYPQPIRSGIIKNIFVQEGDLVTMGQILFEISPTADVKNQLSNAEIDLQEARSNYLGNNNLLGNIELEIQTAKEQLVLDSTNFIRQEKLWAQNIGKKIDFENSKLKYQSSQAQVDILKQKLAQTRVNLQNNYKKAVNRNESQISQLADFTILSEIDGRIYSLQKEVGDFISSQERFAELGSADKFKLEMDIDEVDITKIALGDSVIISLDAYSNEVFVATIDKIFPKKNNATQTFRVESSFKELPNKLYDGLAGEANIIVSKRENALVIPTEYLMPNNKVMTEDGEISIKVGFKNLKFVEVLSGIDSTTTLLKPAE